MIPSKIELEKLYIEQKLTQKEISKKYNVSKASVCRWFDKYQINVNNKRREKEKLSKDILIDLYVNKKLTTQDISEICNVNRVTVGKWLKVYGIPRNDITKPKDIPSKLNLENLYLNELKTLDEIGIVYNVNRNLVSKWLNSYNIKIRLYNVKIEQPTKEILYYLYNDEKLTISDISKIYNTNDSVIRRLFIKYSIEARSNLRKYHHLRAIKFTQEQKEFIVGTMLGDGHLACIGKKKSVRLSIIHSIKQIDYFFWKRKIMSNFINNCNIYEEKKRNSIRISSTSIIHNDFVFYHKLFYDNRKKIINYDLIHHLTPFAMAIWYMDDGWLNGKVSMRISSESFTKKENELLQSIILINFGIRSKVNEYTRNNKKYYYLSFNKANSILLTNLIEPYVVDSMKYKLVKEIYRASTTECKAPLKEDEDTV